MTFRKPEKLEISVNLSKYSLFSSNAEVTFTIESDEHEAAIDQLIQAIQYFSSRYDMKLEAVKKLDKMSDL